MRMVIVVICAGKLDFLESASMELASHLLAAADKYALPRLKVFRVISNISIMHALPGLTYLCCVRLPVKNVYPQGSLWRMLARC